LFLISVRITLYGKRLSLARILGIKCGY